MRIVQKQLLATGNRTAAVDADFQTNGAWALKIDLDWTTDGGDTITPSIQQLDAESSTYDAILTGAGLTAIGHYIYSVGPTLTAVANLTANALLAPQMRFHMAVGGAEIQVYSVGLTLYYLD